jgi:aryl carrier-like protein
MHNGQVVDIESVAPHTSTGKRLACLWQEVLGVPRIGVHDNFFDLGGHSLRATQLASRIGREFGIELPLRMIFEHPTIAEQSQLLEVASGESSLAPLPQIKPVARSAPGSAGHEGRRDHVRTNGTTST